MLAVLPFSVQSVKFAVPDFSFSRPPPSEPLPLVMAVLLLIAQSARFTVP